MQVWWKSVDIYSSYCPEKKFRCTTGGTYDRWTDKQQTDGWHRVEKIGKFPYIFISWLIGRISLELKTEFESAMVNQPLLLESLQFYCILFTVLVPVSVWLSWMHVWLVIPAMSGNILSWKLIMVILSLPPIQEEQLSVSGKRMCTSTGKLLRGLSLSRKTVRTQHDPSVLTGP